MNISLTIIRATGLSAIIFWSIIFTKTFESEILLFVFLSVIPISICCLLTICLTIAPFFWSKKESTSLETIYNRYFPFYAIALFGLCFYAILGSDFDIYVLAFITSAFFTALKSWNWLAEPQKPITT